MADNTTTTTPQSNGVPLSGLPALDAPVNGEELLLITKNNQSLKTTAAALKAYINAEMATLTGMQQAVKAVSDRIDTLVNGDASSAIDTFNEIEAFLAGITDTETLTGLLAELKSAITAETDNKLSGKVDKITGKGLSANDYTDYDKAKLGKLLTNEQFGMSGIFILSADGKEQKDSNYSASGFIPINRQYPIIANVYSTINSSAIALFDATYTFIGALSYGVNTIGGTVDGNRYTLPAAAIPQNAVYFRTGTNKSQLANSYYSNGPTQEAREGAVSEAIQAAKLALFVDQWNSACDTYGKYDPANAPDPQHPFYLNTIWLTYKEAIKSYKEYANWGTNSMDFYCSNIRTNIPPLESSARTYSNSFKGIEAVNLAGLFALSLEACLNGSNLKKVLNFNANYLGKTTNSFNAPKLTDLQISNLKISLNLSKCPLINLASLQHLVTNAANTTEITVTVHPDVYAKLSGDTTNAAAAALTADELTAWQAVMTSAAAKNIAFATTA